MMAHEYHMIAYIRESPDVLQRTLERNEKKVLDLVRQIEARDIRRVVVCGVGSSYTAALIAAPLFRYHCALESHVLTSIELGHYSDRLVDNQTLVVSVSRSGERGWVVDALAESIARGALGIAITGTAGSLMAQTATMALITAEGPEITFPKTKSVICCAGLLMRLALALADPADGLAGQRLEALKRFPEVIDRTIRSLEGPIQNLMAELLRYEPIFVGGTGSNYGAALEAGIKLQETTYVITHGDHTGELLHGSLGPFGREWMMILLTTAFDIELSRQLFDLVGKFGAMRVAIVEPALDVQDHAEHVLAIAEAVDPLMAGLVYLPPLQLMTYYAALARGMNPDAPPGMRDVLDAILPCGREEPELRE
jgi:glucosamine--fructose-6-phosphate aminotransferase (isomerizing)